MLFDGPPSEFLCLTPLAKDSFFASLNATLDRLDVGPARTQSNDRCLLASIEIDSISSFNI